MRKAKSATVSAVPPSSSLDIMDIDSWENLSNKHSSDESNADETYQPSFEKKAAWIRTSEPKSKETLFVQHLTGELHRNKVSDREALR